MRHNKDVGGNKEVLLQPGIALKQLILAIYVAMSSDSYSLLMILDQSSMPH